MEQRDFWPDSFAILPKVAPFKKGAKRRMSYIYKVQIDATRYKEAQNLFFSVCVHGLLHSSKLFDSM
jgi:hypothetical protein